MTKEEFEARIIGMQDTLYRVSATLLRQPCDREDAIQECIYKALRKRDSLREDRFMQSWVTRILINECYSLLRRRRHAVPLDEVPEPVAPPDADPVLHDAIARLDKNLRLPVVLHYMEGYSVSEVAAMLRLPAGTVKTRLFKARKILRLQLIDEDQIERRKS